jgi:uncharacterized small protein (DUF1192 family)
MKSSPKRADMDDDLVKKTPSHEVGMVLDALSVDELHERIALLRAEIERLEGAIALKTESRSAADAVFKI